MRVLGITAPCAAAWGKHFLFGRVTTKVVQGGGGGVLGCVGVWVCGWVGLVAWLGVQYGKPPAPGSLSNGLDRTLRAVCLSLSLEFRPQVLDPPPFFCSAFVPYADNSPLSALRQRALLLFLVDED